MTEDQINSSSTEYLQKFTYRPYEGEFQPRWKRVLYLINFELIATWRKSNFAKVLMIITTVFSFFAIVGAAFLTFVDEVVIRDALNESIANYFSISAAIFSNSEGNVYGFFGGLGILVIIVIGVAGSGYFADDKRGKVIEIYLSRLEKREYVTGKLGAIVIFINLLVLLPLLITGILFVQSLGENPADYLDFYLGIITYSLLTSIILGLFILVLSIFVEKRFYASLIFFLFYFFGSIIGGMIYRGAPNSELLLLISPSNFLILLAYVCLGDYDLGKGVWQTNEENIVVTLNLDNGVGIEYWHVFLVAFIYILVLSLILAYKMLKTTTEEL